MSITSADISDKQFRVVFRGYAIEDVDAFLDELEAEVSTLRAGVAEQPDPPTAPGPAVDTPDAPVQAVRTLRLAETMADQLLAAAGTEADQVLGAARAEADQVLAAARAEADRVLAAARAEADRVGGEREQRRRRELAELERRCGRLRTELDRLTAAQRECRDRIAAALREHQRVLDESAPTPEAGPTGSTPAAAGR